MNRVLIALVMFVLWGMSVPASANTLAQFDAETVTLNQTVTLRVRSNSIKRNITPDLSALEGYFEEINRQTSTRIQTVNGRTSSITEWHIQLLPIQVGKIKISGLTVGGELINDVAITVKPDPNNASTPGAEYFITAHVDNAAPYVQQMALLTIEVAYRVNLRNWSDPKLAIENTQLIPLTSRRKEIQHLGYEYVVYELRYALFAQRSGTLEIPELLYSATLSSPSQRNLSMMSRPGRRVFIRSNPVTLDVQPRPAPTDTPWLPASDVAVNLKHPSLDKFKPGDNLDFELQITAISALDSQIASLELIEEDGLSIYPAPEKRVQQEINQGQTIASQLTQSFSVVPNGGGTFEVPSFSVTWFNTNTNTYETARSQPYSFRVEGPAYKKSEAPATSAEPITTRQEIPSISLDKITNDLASFNWRPLAYTLGSLALMTLIAYWLVRYITRPIWSYNGYQLYKKLSSRAHLQTNKALTELLINDDLKARTVRLSQDEALTLRERVHLSKAINSAINDEAKTSTLSVLNRSSLT